MTFSFRSSCILAASVSLSVFFSGCGDGGGNGGGENGGTGGTPQETEFISLGTAPVGGAFYQVGAALGDVLNDGSDIGGWREVTAESTGGSLENIRRLDSAELQFAMANSSITYFAVRGAEGFDKAYEVRSVMTMFPLVAMFVSKKGNGIESIADLKDKRVAVGPEGAGFEYFIKPILKEHGLTYDDFEQVYAGFSTSAGYLGDGSVDATFLGGGIKAASITSAASTMDISLVPYADAAREKLVADFPSFSQVTVKGGTYRGVDEDYPGLNVGSCHLICRADADEELVYNATKVIYEARDIIAEKHPAGKFINDKNAARPNGTDFHPGAIRYFKEIGIWPEDEPAEDSVDDSPPQESAEPPIGDPSTGEADEATSSDESGDDSNK